MPDRREFLAWIVRAAALPLVIGPPGRMAAEPKKVAFRLDRAPRLREVGGAVVLKLKDRPVLLVRDGESGVRALDATCTHKACIVGYDAPGKVVACPCHGSRFELDGTVRKGPAERPLKAYEAALDGDRVIVTLD